MFGFLIFTAVNIFNVNGYNITDRELEERLQLIFNSSYNSKLPPGLNADEPLIVTVQLYILSIDSISDASNDFAMSFFLRQRWKDPRLAYDPVPGMPAFQLNHKAINGVWVPDIFLLNEKEADVHHVVVPNKLMHIKPDGSILYSIRVSGKFACDVDLTKYPLDQQVCPLIIESYGYTTEIVRLLWHEEAVEKREDIIMSEFDFEDVKMFKCDKTYFGLNFSCVQMNMRLDRKYGYYILQTYIPSCLIVILSWVSFWISIDATPARISLGLLTVLTMTTQSTSLPQMYYFKAIDIWMVTCLCFVFAALIEFAYVNVLARVQQRRRESTRNATVDDIKGSASPQRRMKQTSGLCFKNMGNREKARNVDRISRVVFPFLFFMFNVIYWIVYFHVVKTCTVHKDAYRDCS